MSFIRVNDRAPRFDYDRLLMSGVPIYMQNGIDYTQTTDNVKYLLRGAARRRGLKLILINVYAYDGIMFQAHLKKNGRPVLPKFQWDTLTKETHKFLFCLQDDCENRLRPLDQITGLCSVHTEH